MSYVNPPTTVTASGASFAASINTIVLANPATTTGVTLPTPTGNAGRSVTVKVITTNSAVTVSPNSGEQIDGSATGYQLKCLNQLATFTSDGTNWRVTAMQLGGNAGTMLNTAMANLGGFNSASSGGGALVTTTSSTVSTTLSNPNNPYKVLQGDENSPFIAWTTGALNGALHTAGNLTLTAAFPCVNTVGTGGGNCTVTLPSAAATDVPGKVFLISKNSSDANTVQINTVSSQIITGAASGSILLTNQYDYALIQANNQGSINKWHLLASNPAFKTHLVGGTAAPAASPGAGAGASGTASVSGTDLSGTITITTNVADTPSASATIATITFSKPFNTPPRVVFSPANPTANGLAFGVSQVNQADITSTSFLLTSGAVPLPTLTTATYMYNYIVIQ